MKQYLFFGLAISILLSCVRDSTCLCANSRTDTDVYNLSTNTATNTANQHAYRIIHDYAHYLSFSPQIRFQPTFTVTPTLHPFTPGDPTSTPLGERYHRSKLPAWKNRPIRIKITLSLLNEMQLALATDPNLAFPPIGIEEWLIFNLETNAGQV